MTNQELLEEIFEINDEITLTKKDKEYLDDIKAEVKDLIEEYGVEGDTRIKESILDKLLRDNKGKIIQYLSLGFEQEIQDSLESKLNDPEFRTVENKEEERDFLKSFLMDEMLNDLLYSWKGYIRKSDGAKEKFVKVRKAIIPTDKIDAIYNLLQNNFNKINFVADKSDDEQADIIVLTLEQTLDILLEIPNDCCDTSDVISIMGAVSTKMMNLIGYSQKNMDKVMNAVSESYESRLDTKEGGTTVEQD